MNEIFKDIPGYEGYYQISNLGNVKSLERWINASPYGYLKKESILINLPNGIGYYAVRLHKNKNIKTWKIHTLVAMAFLNHTPNGFKLVVDHINHIKTDNRLENLQLITNRKNCSKDNFRHNYSSKYVGVCWDKTNKKWISSISINRSSKHLGRYTSEYDAHLAYQNALKKL